MNQKRLVSILVVIGVIIIVGVVWYFVVNRQTVPFVPSPTPTPTPTPISTPTPIASVRSLLEMSYAYDTEPQSVVISGIVKTGAEINREYCSQGLYLTDDTGAIQLRVKDEMLYSKMIDDTKYLGEKVEVRGKYPAQQVFCQAEICECENYILVDSLVIIE